MEEGVEYEVSVEVILRENNLAFWQGSKKVLINPTPLDGHLSVDPWQGSAFDTEFNFSTSGWIVRHEPAEYQFMYLDSNEQFSVLSPYQSEPSLSVKLPPTKEIIVKVRDA